MENLKSGDVPALVTNIEVMNILSKRLNKRKEEEEAAMTFEDGLKKNKSLKDASSNRKNNKLKHRDYIEKSVYEYLAHSPCAHANMDNMPGLVSRLRGNDVRKRKQQKKIAVKKELLNDDELNADADGQHLDKMVKREEGETDAVDESQYDETDANPERKNFGLTDAETLQILNHMPTIPVEIHLIIEDLTNRLNDEEQNSLLELISQHSGK